MSIMWRNVHPGDLAIQRRAKDRQSLGSGDATWPVISL